MRFSSGTGWSENRFSSDDASDCGSDGSFAVSNWRDCVDLDATDNRAGDDCRSYTHAGTDADAYTSSDPGVESNADAHTKTETDRHSILAGARGSRNTEQLRPDWRRTRTSQESYH